MKAISVESVPGTGGSWEKILSAAALTGQAGLLTPPADHVMDPKVREVTSEDVGYLARLAALTQSTKAIEEEFSRTAKLLKFVSPPEEGNALDSPLAVDAAVADRVASALKTNGSIEAEKQAVEQLLTSERTKISQFLKEQERPLETKEDMVEFVNQLNTECQMLNQMQTIKGLIEGVQSELYMRGYRRRQLRNIFDNLGWKLPAADEFELDGFLPSDFSD